MIAFVRGILAETWDNSCIVITASGLGYELALTSRRFAALPAQGADVEFYAFLVTREDARELYGFETFEERQTFRILVSISKVGAKTALAMLSVFTPQDLRQIVIDENPRALEKVPGIGAKTAQHIFLELKYKLGAINNASAPAPAKNGGVFHDTLAALENLGYGADECAPVIREILNANPDLDAGEAIRMTLKTMAIRKI